MGFSPFFVPPAHTDWQPRSAGFAILTPISAARLAPPLRWICNPAWLPVAVSAGVVLSQVSCRKAKLKFSSPGGTTLRPFQDHQAALHRSRTAVPGTNEFQVRLNSQLQHEHELIGRRKRPLRGALADLQVDAYLYNLLPGRRARAPGSFAEGSPRARPAWRATCLYEAAAESASSERSQHAVRNFR